ncbi:MAG: hypothetical protein Ct9H300mP9_8340 [Candidatus Neomarinimicrobiota bacterium]|nr:MAG: hypothetical protein Ct9H300mP9_8340 [Candidatus Neomarinimicrobiota bacterium]
MRRTSLWAMTRFKQEPTRKGAMPISRKRVIVPGASLAWTVENTRWPVSANFTAISAVSHHEFLRLIIYLDLDAKWSAENQKMSNQYLQKPAPD